MKYSDQQRIEKIIDKAERLLDYLEKNSVTKQRILEDETIRWTITTPLYNIGEQAYQLSDEFIDSHNDIPWMKISGLRHRLVHDYDNTNWSIICSVLYDILPEFLEQIKKI